MVEVGDWPKKVSDLGSQTGGGGEGTKEAKVRDTVRPSIDYTRCYSVCTQFA